MGFRFRQVLSVVPGLRLNLSKSGISTSLGVQGATANISKNGVRGTVGIPGSGVSYSKMFLRSGRGVPSSVSRATEPKSSLGQERKNPRTSHINDEALADLYLLTAHLVVGNANASPSWLQRQFRIEYIEAAELIEQLEAGGIVSPPDKIGRRKVLVDVQSLPELPE
ncbi:DUF4236 domain-containing protein [Sphingomonas sp. IW22]|uniref:DUF4236 domain-containing protein n=1 Tax=Sphingomonas sp. IW22 TaxID=3242489 RepID=UPI003521DBA6